MQTIIPVTKYYSLGTGECIIIPFSLGTYNTLACMCVYCIPVRRSLPLSMVHMICFPLPVASMVSVLVLGAVLLTFPPVPAFHRAGWEGVPAHALLWPVPPVASALHSSCGLQKRAGTLAYAVTAGMAAVSFWVLQRHAKHKHAKHKQRQTPTWACT